MLAPQNAGPTQAIPAVGKLPANRLSQFRPAPQQPPAYAPGAASKHWRREVRRRVALCDAFVVYIAVFAAFVVRLGVGDLFDWAPTRVVNHYAITALVLFGVWLAALRWFDTYDVRLMGLGVAEYARVSNVTFIVFGLLAIFAYLLNWSVGRSFVGIALPLGLALLNGGRYAMRRTLIKERASGQNVLRALVVGSAASAGHVADEIGRHPDSGLDVAGLCIGADIPYAASRAAAAGVDTVIVTSADAFTPANLKRLAWELEPHGIDLVMANGPTDVSLQRIQTLPITGLPMIRLRPPGYTAPQQRLKRLSDVVGSSLLIALFALPLAVVATIIKLTSPGPVFFKQTRVGVKGQEFQVFKFRSMCVDAESRWLEVMSATGDQIGLLNKVKDDPRITQIGKFIRRYSIDELPQLFNVFRGEMSLVGPRPPLPAEVALYDDGVERRLFVRPGMTGLWQVSGRSNLAVPEAMRLDLYYVENWSITEDLLILLRTAKAVIGKDGAY